VRARRESNQPMANSSRKNALKNRKARRVKARQGKLTMEVKRKNARLLLQVWT